MRETVCRPQLRVLSPAPTKGVSHQWTRHVRKTLVSQRLIFEQIIRFNKRASARNQCSNSKVKKLFETRLKLTILVVQTLDSANDVIRRPGYPRIPGFVVNIKHVETEGNVFIDLNENKTLGILRRNNTGD